MKRVITGFSISLIILCFITCSTATDFEEEAPVEIGNPDSTDTSVTFEFDFKEGGTFTPGDSVNFKINTNPNSEVFFFAGLKFITPKNEPLGFYDLWPVSVEIKGEGNIQAEIVDVICRNECFFQLIVGGFLENHVERVLLDTLIQVNITPESSVSENSYFPLNEENIYIYERSSDGWMTDSENIEDTLTISTGYLERERINGLNTIDFKVRINYRNGIKSILNKPIYDRKPEAFIINEYNMNIYGISISDYDSANYYIDLEDLTIPLSAEEEIDYWFEDQERGISFLGYGEASFDDRIFESKKYYNHHLFGSGTYTFIKDIGLYEFTAAGMFGDFIEVYKLKGAVIDGVVYGDTTKTLN